jgi:NH3-dependent NAD+ synthetase
MTFVGIDVSKSHLARRLTEANPERVVLEATGGYERRVAAALAVEAADHPEYDGRETASCGTPIFTRLPLDNQDRCCGEKLIP